jgi:hypothetical protein
MGPQGRPVGMDKFLEMHFEAVALDQEVGSSPA